MTLLHVVTRGVRFRPGRSLVVVALAAVATAAAVMTPSYIAAAHQSLLTDALDDIPPGLDGVRVTAEGHRVQPRAADFDELFTAVDARITGDARLSALREGIRFSQAEVTVVEARQTAAAQVMYREDLCRHLVMDSGDCGTGAGEVLVSRRSAALEDVTVGDTLKLGAPGGERIGAVEVTVAGIYEPRAVADGFWGSADPFRHSVTGDEIKVDALFMTDPAPTAALDRPVAAGVEYPIDAAAVRVADTPGMTDALAAADGATAATRPLTIESRLPATVETAESEASGVAATVPLVTVPLLLLAWFVVYLAVARLAEERAPQIALAKLRGHRFAAVTGFGVGEAALLVALGIPPGVLLGWGLVEALARTTLASTASAGLTTEVGWYAVAALSGAWAAVLLACRPVLIRPVQALLRRVPVRATWRTGLIEATLATATAVAVWQLSASRDAGTLGLLAAPLSALFAGVLVARAVELVARRRLPGAIRRGHVGRVLALAQVSRRPETRRMVVLVTVAVAVVTFGVCAWDVSRHNRDLVAGDELGADRVYSLAGGDPQSVMDAVDALDPDGEQLMAVLRRFDRYDNRNFTTVAVQSERLSTVADWRDMDAAQLSRLADGLHPDRPAPLRVTGELAVTATAGDYSAKRRPSLVARIADDTGSPVTLRLGELSKGRATYRAAVPDCPNGCRLIGVGVSRDAGDFDTVSATVRVTRLADANGELDAHLDDCGRWQPVGDLPAEVPLELDCPDGLSIAVTSDDPHDYLAEYASAPAVLPVALAGDMPSAEVSGAEFTATAPHREQQRYLRQSSVPVVPRGGTRAMLVDLEYTALTAQNFTGLSDGGQLSVEVWANDSAPADLEKRLTDAGLVVDTVEDREQLLERMSRAAPAMSLRLYLMAAGLALLLVVGAAMLTATIGAAVRGYDTAALRLAGVTPRRLRAASVREQLYWIVAPTLAGVAAGAVGLALVLPKVPLVSLEPAEVPASYAIGVWWPVGGAAAVIAGFAATVWLTVRSGLRRGAVSRLRAGNGREWV